MKFRWNWRINVFAALVLAVFQTDVPGQVHYGQPYGTAPQMGYNPGPAAFAYDPGMFPATPYAVPASHPYGGAPAMPMMPPAVYGQPPYEQPAYGPGTACDGTSEYLLHDGHRIGPWGRHLAAVLGFLAPYSETGCCAPHWFDVHAEAVFLRRDDDAPFRELVRSGSPLGPAVMTTSDLDFDTLEASLRVTGTWQTGPGSNLELTYFGLNDYSKRREAFSPNNLLFAAFDNFGLDESGIPDPEAFIAQFHRATFQQVQLDTDFDSLELNYRRRWRGHKCLVQGSWLIGVRYFELKDTMQFYSLAERDMDPPPGEIDSGGEALYTLRTRNYITGAQLGGDVWVCLVPGLRIGLDAKAGVYGNNVKANTSLVSDDPFDDFGGFFPEALGNDKVTFIGELGFLLTYQLTHNFTFRGGYQMMWVEGVATALDNFNPTIAGRIPFLSDGGSLFYDGFTVGAEYMW